MKKIVVLIFCLFFTTPAYANDEGAWVKVDANGKAIGQAIVCTPAVCGDSESLYSKLTLQPGERYVLQSKADSNGNVTGVGAGQRANAEVQVNLQTNEWTVITKNEIEIKEQENVEITEKPKKIKVTAETVLVEKINIDNSLTTVINTVDVKSEILEMPPVTNNQETVNDWYADFLTEWQSAFELLNRMFEGWQFLW